VRRLVVAAFQCVRGVGYYRQRWLKLARESAEVIAIREALQRAQISRVAGGVQHRKGCGGIISIRDEEVAEADTRWPHCAGEVLDLRLDNIV
jgi:hypothetical protein